jgi:hypothetical protein
MEDCARAVATYLDKYENVKAVDASSSQSKWAVGESVAALVKEATDHAREYQRCKTTGRCVALCVWRRVWCVHGADLVFVYALRLCVCVCVRDYRVAPIRDVIIPRDDLEDRQSFMRSYCPVRCACAWWMRGVRRRVLVPCAVVIERVHGLTTW